MHKKESPCAVLHYSVQGELDVEVLSLYKENGP